MRTTKLDSHPFVLKETSSRAISTFRLASLAAVCFGATGLSGCGAPFNSVPAPSLNSEAVSGSVHGGQQPISGATVSLIVPGTTGYGSAGTVLVSTTSGATGQFTLPRPYTCPANSGLVYILATGGNAGAGINPLIAEAAVVGPCSALTASTFISVNEVTTIAAAYALAPFATVTAASTGIGTSATNLQGFYNAAGTANNLANTATGVAHATGDLSGIVPPTAEVNTLADVIAACINQGTPSVPATTCATLFTAATPSGGIPPTDTFQAAINIALHPANHTASLFGLVTASGPFQPTLATAPADFSVALAFNGGAISFGGTVGIAIDAAGNAWITTTDSSAAIHSITEISPAGVYLSGSTVAASTGFGFSNLLFPIGIGFDTSGKLYVAANSTQHQVVKFNSDGTFNSAINSSLTFPNGLAVDAGSNVWVADYSNTTNHLAEITSAGVESTRSPFITSVGGVDVAAGPLAIWETDYGSAQVSRVDLTSFAVTNTFIGGPAGGIAVDHANNAWVAVSGNGNIFEINNAGSNLAPFGGYALNPNCYANSIIIDGLGNAFVGAYVSNSSMGSLAEFSNSGVLLSPAAGFIGSNAISVSPSAVEGIRIDGSGNVWIAGSNNGTAFPNYVTEVVGIAAPVVTPQSVAAANNTVGTRP
jgi:sugar lactone lactonase YvrE